jgi:hypothetical protein
MAALTRRSGIMVLLVMVFTVTTSITCTYLPLHLLYTSNQNGVQKNVPVKGFNRAIGAGIIAILWLNLRVLLL